MRNLSNLKLTIMRKMNTMKTMMKIVVVIEMEDHLLGKWIKNQMGGILTTKI